MLSGSISNTATQLCMDYTLAIEFYVVTDKLSIKCWCSENLKKKKMKRCLKPML